MTRSEQLRVLRDRSLWRLLRAGQRVGVDLAPHHFYSNTPDLRRLEHTSYWRAPRSMQGVRGASITDQVDTLDRWVPAQLSDFLERHDVHRDACEANGEVGYGPIEAQLLYAFAVTQRPRRVIQIGSGVSTAVLLRAKAAEGLDTEIVCVDPFPTTFLKAAANRGDITLLVEPAQVVPAETLTSLGEGDLLFIDSTHTVKVGSEVNRLVLEILPVLAPGVFVHVHDVYFPYDYGPNLLDGELFFWNESVLLHALLVGNEHLSVRVSTSMLHHGAPDALRRAFRRYTPRAGTDGIAPGPGDFPSAIYLQTD